MLRLQAGIRRATKLESSLADLFNASTLDEMAQLVGNAARTTQQQWQSLPYINSDIETAVQEYPAYTMQHNGHAHKPDNTVQQVLLTGATGFFGDSPPPRPSRRPLDITNPLHSHLPSSFNGTRVRSSTQ
ncbi:hypothetical protein ASPCAL01072 [Aspergillus calidoustus]|uniref:Uncharacterized protein n=1 Tax=Aspergillus calidoustus TaxID=454130 RepID=A0A0U5FPV2_ASPCI|nr:hypothetical protein ASPCAL01072 [Aspergillus calidoustus]